MENKNHLLNHSKIAHQLQKNIKVTNLKNDEIHYFKSKSQASKFCGCSPALVYLICENKNNVKTYKNTYKFEYSDISDNPESFIMTIIPDPRIGKSKYTPEEKKQRKKDQAKAYKDKKKLQEEKEKEKEKQDTQ